MAKSTTVISIPQMVDLALNSPEVGIVNFTVLHSLLHVIVNQLDLGDCNVEFRGSDSERLQSYIASAKPGPIITLTEYTVGPDGKGRARKRKKGKRVSAGSVTNVIPEEKGKADEGQKEKEIAVIKKEGSATLKSDSSASFQTIVVVEPASKENIRGPKFSIALTKEQYNKIEDDIKGLENKIKELTEMPTNIGLIDALRQSGTEKTSPILDMFHTMTLAKRLDATETALEKLASMIEDLAKEQMTLAQRTSAAPAGMFMPAAPAPAAAPAQSASQDVVEKATELRKSLDSGQMKLATFQLQEIEKRISIIEDTIKKFETSGPPRPSNASEINDSAKRKMRDSTMKPVKEEEETPADGGLIDFEATDLSEMSPTQAILILQQELIKLKNNAQSDLLAETIKEIEDMKNVMSANKESLPPDVRLAQVELKFADFVEQVNALDTMFNDHFDKIQERVAQLEKEFVDVWERINLGLPAGDATVAGAGGNLGELGEKFRELQEEIAQISETAQRLMEDKDLRQNTMDVLIEQIELLKTVKADREDLEDALADKADACQINRKVSHDQFDAAYDEISKNLQNTLDKLEKQEEIWHQALDDIQKEIGNKLDKMELNPLRDFINSKLKSIQDKFKKISALKSEHEAAGAKSKYLRNVNCISCDNEVVMRTEVDATQNPRPYAMPPPKSVGPYLAFELDQLRKHQKGLPNTKNMNMLENALLSARGEKGGKNHLCNRYCGGSHTVTTPQQRVTRVGHFMEQWGPEIAPAYDCLIKGTDGQLYRGRDDEALKKLSQTKPPAGAIADQPPIIVKSAGDSSGPREKEHAFEREVKQGDILEKKEKERKGSTGSTGRQKSAEIVVARSASKNSQRRGSSKGSVQQKSSATQENVPAEEQPPIKEEGEQ